MDKAVLDTAISLLGFTLALVTAVAGPVGWLAYIVGSKVGEHKDAQDKLARKNEVTRLNAENAQKERQISDLNRLLQLRQADSTSENAQAELNRRIELARTHLSIYGNTVWTLSSDKAPEIKKTSDLRVVTFANNKGGVGKTTLSTNFVAYLLSKGHRVLAIDMDYQGSMSATMLAATQTATLSGVEPDDIAKAYSWLEDSFDPQLFLRTLTKLDLRKEVAKVQTPLVRLSESNYDLPTEEDRRLFQWMIGEAKTDIRYRLRQLVWSDAVQSAFDFVVIDAPPKLSVGSVNALAASTHFVVPTILDTLSSAPVRLLLSSYSGLFGKLGIKPRLCGVAVVKTRQSSLNKDERERIDNVNSMLRAANTPARVFETHIPFSVEYARAAGVSFAFEKPSLRPRLELLFDEILAKTATASP